MCRGENSKRVKMGRKYGWKHLQDGPKCCITGTMIEREGGGAGWPKTRGLRCGGGVIVPKRVQTGLRCHRNVLKAKGRWKDDET
jgi:hypothetical protein